MIQCIRNGQRGSGSAGRLAWTVWIDERVPSGAERIRRAGSARVFIADRDIFQWEHLHSLRCAFDQSFLESDTSRSLRSPRIAKYWQDGPESDAITARWTRRRFRSKRDADGRDGTCRQVSRDDPGIAAYRSPVEASYSQSILAARRSTSPHSPFSKCVPS